MDAKRIHSLMLSVCCSVMITSSRVSSPRNGVSMAGPVPTLKEAVERANLTQFLDQGNLRHVESSGAVEHIQVPSVVKVSVPLNGNRSREEILSILAARAPVAEEENRLHPNFLVAFGLELEKLAFSQKQILDQENRGKRVYVLELKNGRPAFVFVDRTDSQGYFYLTDMEGGLGRGYLIRKGEGRRPLTDLESEEGLQRQISHWSQWLQKKSQS